MNAVKQPSPNLFATRYLALVQDDLTGETEAGNPQPAVIDPLLAFDSVNTSGAVVPDGFYVDLNACFSEANENLIAFPTFIFERIDVCVMDRKLFISLLDGSAQDEEAKIMIDSAPPKALELVKRNITNEDGTDAGIPS